MQFDGAVVEEQGVTFAIAMVKSGTINFRNKAEDAIRGFQQFFQGMPIILAEQNSRGIPTYYGRPDIVKFLANIPFHAIPWKRYTY